MSKVKRPIVTKDELDRLRAQRPTANRHLTYEIDGPVQAVVKSNVESERIGQINRGDRRMHTAVQTFRAAMNKARSGQARGQFRNVARKQPTYDRER